MLIIRRRRRRWPAGLANVKEFAGGAESFANSFFSHSE